MKKTISLMLVCLLALTVIGSAFAEQTEPAYGFRGDETVEEQLLYDSNGLRITATGLGIVMYAPVLKLRVENTSGRRLGLDLQESALNDWMWDASLCLYEENGEGEDVYNEVMDLTVDDGTTLKCGLGFSNEYYYEPCGIVGFGEIGFALSVYDPDTGEALFTTPAIDVATSLGADYPGLYVDTGTLAYDANGLRILIVDLSTSEFGDTSALIYVNNFSDRPVIVSAERCAVNGTQTDPWFSAEVSPGRQCLAEMGFDSDLPKIDALSVAFRVEAYDASADTTELIGISDAIEVDF